MKKYVPFLKSGPSVSVLRLNGVIASGGAGRLNDAGLAPLIEKAFRKKPDAIALQINSPGGSPVQSSLIAQRIRRLADEKNIKVYAFVEDVAASGGYWLATAADEIWADRSSIVGSIGVISASFGFDKILSRQGVERRVHTAGGSKSFMDPFLPEKPEDVARLLKLQDQIHRSFIDQVKERRGERLAQKSELFTGEFWVGNTALDLGLIDGIGHLVPKMKELFGDKVKFSVYRQKRPFWRGMGAQVVGDALAEFEERASYARFGL